LDVARTSAGCYSVPRAEGASERSARPAFESDPVIEAYKKDVDRTLLRENLKRSVEERLRDLMRLQRFADEWRRAARRAFR
jgi:hypothetical protein